MSQDAMYSYIENKIKKNEFKNKEELNQYIIYLKNKNMISQEQILMLISLYDKLYPVQNKEVNLENYKGVGLENQNLIVSTQSDRILKTESSPENMPKEFISTQNDMIVRSNNTLENADAVFNQMANTKKEEMKLIPLSEIHTIGNIDADILRKIRFLISNKYINPYVFRINLDNCLFYNMETSEVLEVRKNEETNQYQIYRGSELVYGDTFQNNDRQIISEKITDINEEEKIYENQNTKVKRLVPPKHQNYDNRAAFSKMNFLLLIMALAIVTLTVIIAIKTFN